ncbi:MAG TPA: sugar phosphate isomerase/epimerase [Erwinia sp.]|uniref:sugar phosphate isomerase/epimerase family protein n=1 Tax=Erwinia citreus TaxID=558 RepID=UPI000E9DF292|nr:sugar phosphate isomerase/epimerase family protein [Erwinia sp.]HBV39374.1 sugar phosphate isomerase/epimerase [Erwinia sp.]
MRFQHNPLFINTILLSGTTEEKLRAAAQAGFSQVELWRQDVDSAEDKARSVVSVLKEQQLSLTDYQVLLDFDGAPDEQREEKRRDALKMMDTAVVLGATTLLVPASTQKECIAGREEEDLRWLVQEAGNRGLRVAFEAMAWSTHINTLAAAWQLVKRIDEPNLGLVVDAFHIFVRNRTIADLNGIPMEKIFLVQLSDLAALPSGSELVETARHHRLLPGQGHFPLYTLLDYLEAEGYSGPVGLEVFNDEIKQRSPSDAAREAMHALKRCCAQTTLA